MNLEKQYEDLLQPSDTLIRSLAELTGDIMILGVGGKMGPSLALLAKKAIHLAGTNKKVIGVARFSDAGLQAKLRLSGIETIKADLLNDTELQALPEVENILFLAGTKFGTTGNEPFTWAMNTYLPGRVAQKFRTSRTVVFSTGNVYPLTSVHKNGAKETDRPAPIGEYAQSCLGRERLFQYFSNRYSTPLLIYRLNYANDISYGVLTDIALAVKHQQPIDVSMGYVNVIWQQDANDIALRSLHHCRHPGLTVNVTGPEKVSVRSIANAFSEIFETKAIFTGREQETALLSDASEACSLFGPPRVSVSEMINVIGTWIKQGGNTLQKPTHFQERAGNF